MDAATRAELDALRVRAYSPAADIADDAPALERLAALEDLARPAPVLDLREDEREPVAARAPESRSARVVGVVPSPPRRQRPRRHGALVAGVGVVAIVLGVAAAVLRGAGGAPVAETPVDVRDALAFANHPSSELLITVRIDGSFGDYVDIPSSGDVPLFPVEGLMTWVEPIGDYFGWRVWLGGARGAIDDENCLLLDGDGTMRADCVPVDLKSEGALLLSVPFAEIPPDERPPTMTEEQSLGFWWAMDGTVKILLAPTPPD